MFCELNVWNDIKSIKNTINYSPQQRKDFIAETRRELLRIMIVTTKEPQEFLPSVNECKNINEVDDHKAAEVTHSLLAFSRKQSLIPKPVLINDIVKRFEKLLSGVIGEDITISTVLSREEVK